MEKNRTLIYSVCAQLKVKPAELEDKLHAQADEIKGLKRAIESFQAKEAAGQTERFLYGARSIGGLHVLTVTVPDADAAKLRQMGDLLREKDPTVAAVLCTVRDDKITFLAVCGKEAVAKGIKAGDLVKQVCSCCGGSGGGKPDSAMGGGKDVNKVDDALAAVDDFVCSKLN
jgi:alanyl-tRNA synthetase